ncbi:MAG: DUF4286 family protein [Acidobacteria bacterium]|nr:DUF4286 family protein [Acidobacteriota bacterium]
MPKPRASKHSRELRPAPKKSAKARPAPAAAPGVPPSAPVKRAAKKKPAASKAAGPRAAYIVEIEVDPAAEAPWFRWEIDEHIPEVLAEPGFLDATFYRIEDSGDWPRYQVLYRLESREALDAYLSGEAVQRLRREAMAKYGSVMRITRRLMNESAFLAPRKHRAKRR